MSKSDPIERALDRLADLLHTSATDSVVDELRQFLSNRPNLAVAKAQSSSANWSQRTGIGSADPFDERMAGAPRPARAVLQPGRSVWLL